MCAVNTFTLLSFSGVGFSSALSSWVAEPYRTLLCSSTKGNSFSTMRASRPVVYPLRDTPPAWSPFIFILLQIHVPRLAGNPAFSQDSLDQTYSLEVRSKNPQTWLRHCLLPLPWCPTPSVRVEPFPTKSSPGS